MYLVNINTFNNMDMINIHDYYNFTTAQSKTIQTKLIFYAEKQISRVYSIFKLSSIMCDIELAIIIETSIFEYSLIYIINNNIIESLFQNIYKDKLNSVVYDITNGDDIVNKLKTGIIKPQVIAFMTPSQLCPEKWKAILDKKRICEEKSNNIPTTDAYKCYKCGMKKCTVSMMQTRSSDEPMTIFIRCCNCYNTWTK